MIAIEISPERKTPTRNVSLTICVHVLLNLGGAAFTCKNTQYPPYPCPFCCRAYSSWGFRRRHIKAMHTLSTQLPCKWCSAVLLSRDQWEGHVVSDHQLSKADAEQGLMVLEEAHMVLQTQPNANAPAHVDMVRLRQLAATVFLSQLD